MSNMNIDELYPRKWVIPDDLKGKLVEVTITGWEIVTVYNELERSDVRKLAISFKGTDKRLILNKTQTFAIADLLGSRETDDWVGHRIGLAPGVARNKKATIVIRAATPQQPSPLADRSEDDETGIPLDGDDDSEAIDNHIANDGVAAGEDQYIETGHLEDDGEELQIPE